MADMRRTQPLSREQREKAALKARREGFERFDDRIDEPLKVTAEAKGVYISGQPPREKQRGRERRDQLGRRGRGDADRFRTDVAGEERRRRDAAQVAQQQRLVQKRDSALAREERRWESMASASVAEDHRMDRKRALGLAAKKNAPSLPFNPITLEYGNNYDGGMLQHKDEMVKYRSALRTHNLYTKQNGDFNPVTGEPRRDVNPPAKPQTPQR